MSAKYPRTPHLPFSPGGTNDDRRLETVDHLLNRRLVATEKMDGSNLLFSRESVFARSHATAPVHPSFDAAKALHAGLRYILPEGLTLFGEWCYAVHSIAYKALPAHFLLFGVRDEHDGTCLAWPIVSAYAEEFGLVTVPRLDTFQASTPQELQEVVERLTAGPSTFGGDREGLVIRVIDSFPSADFAQNVAKWVRADHVQTDGHWKHKQIEKQGLKP